MDFSKRFWVSLDIIHLLKDLLLDVSNQEADQDARKESSYSQVIEQEIHPYICSNRFNINLLLPSIHCAAVYELHIFPKTSAS